MPVPTEPAAPGPREQGRSLELPSRAQGAGDGPHIGSGAPGAPRNALGTRALSLLVVVLLAVSLAGNRSFSQYDQDAGNFSECVSRNSISPAETCIDLNREVDIREDAERGQAYAQFQLGLMYMEGYGVPQDYQEAVKWHKLAAGQGDSDAQLYLGIMYWSGMGVPLDDEEAVKWYRLSADQGHRDAQFLLGTMYSSGNGVSQNHSEAARWFRMSADQGMSDAQFRLGVMYSRGHGVPRDYEEAVRWYRLSADQGHRRAQYRLAGCRTYPPGGSSVRCVARRVSLRVRALG